MMNRRGFLASILGVCAAAVARVSGGRQVVQWDSTWCTSGATFPKWRQAVIYGPATVDEDHVMRVVLIRSDGSTEVLSYPLDTPPAEGDNVVVL